MESWSVSRIDEYWYGSTTMCPHNWKYSEALDVAGALQVGYATFDGNDHAGFWSGSAASWADLNRAETFPIAYATSGTQQVGIDTHDLSHQPRGYSGPNFSARLRDLLSCVERMRQSTGAHAHDSCCFILCCNRGIFRSG